MYAAVGIMLAGPVVFMFSGFYKIEFYDHPILATIAVVFACAGALILRAVRKRRHIKAHRAEYDKATLKHQ